MHRSGAGSPSVLSGALTATTSILLNMENLTEQPCAAQTGVTGVRLQLLQDVTEHGGRV
jgi:hypothetical protein